METDQSCTINIVPMTQAEYSGKGKRITISYSLVTVSAGRYLVASTSKGVCFIMPGEMRWNPVESLRKHFPHAQFRCRKVEMHNKAVWLLKRRIDKVDRLTLHLWGTPFQLSVWTDLLHIPSGKVTTYQNIANRIGKPKAARPVGQAVSANPVMRIIPCHRVVCSNGKLGGYRWGVDRKIKFLNQESRPTDKMYGRANWDPTLF